MLECLESIVKDFSQEIVSYAPDLINHLLKMFCSLAKADNDGDDGDSEDEPDANSPASAALSTIKQILGCNLSA